MNIKPKFFLQVHTSYTHVLDTGAAVLPYFLKIPTRAIVHTHIFFKNHIKFLTLFDIVGSFGHDWDLANAMSIVAAIRKIKKML